MKTNSTDRRSSKRTVTRSDRHQARQQARAIIGKVRADYSEVAR